MESQHPQTCLQKARPPEQRVQLAAETLLAGQSSVRIVHNGQVYQLSLTRNDKLILTK